MATNSPPSQVAVVIVPLPAQGHLNQLLHLGRIIATYNIPVHYVSTANHTRQARQRAHGFDTRATTNIHFHEFPIPEFQSPAPDPNALNKFPSHFMPLFNVLSHLRHPLTALVDSLSRTANRVVVVHDSLMSSVAQDVASVPNAESYIFQSVSAFSVFLYYYEGMGKPFAIDRDEEESIPSLDDCFTEECMEFIVNELKCGDLSSGSVFNASRVIEGKYLSLFEKLPGNEHKKHFAIGPFNPIELKEKKDDHECLKWLDKQEPNSVLFISFGTSTSLPDEQIHELANGLEQSRVKFIWVLRDADRGDSNIDRDDVRNVELPKGFEERVKERGVIIRDWAPQLEILGHFATGGFLSHCGWNSCMESISMGVPIGTWPMHSDQPRNAVLITEILKIGVVVKDWSKRGEVVTSSIVSGAVKRLMMSEEGAKMRQRTVELSGDVRGAVAEGGVTRLELDDFVAHISR